MPWIQLKINTTDRYAESFSDLLDTLGAVSVTFQDTFDTPVFEPKLGETELWNNTDVIGLFDEHTDKSTLETALKQSSLAEAILALTIETLEDKQWERVWMDDFHPMRFGQRLWICPTWCDIPDPSAVNVLLDPGLAFGTGTHPTTALCLTWLDSLDLKNKTVIDFGCGSGILAIAALKLGAKEVIGIDIDPQAIEASLENAKRNGVDQQITLYLAHEAPDELMADVVVANILAGPLKELAKPITQRVKVGGWLGLSGILATQADEVSAAYRDHFTLDPIEISDEWCRITGQKR